MRKLLGVLALCAATAFAADVSGKWTGSLELDGESETGTAYLDLHQDGDRITGMAGPRQDHLFAIKSGKIDGNKIHLEVEAPGDDGPRLVILDLTVDGAQMSGDITMHRPDDSITKGKLAVKRES